jgi:RimJ/RimL family protein N-acetyltransferase
MSFPESVETERLLLRWQQESDAAQMYSRYASDPEVTRYMSWGPHRSVDETIAFLRQREAEQPPGDTFNWLVFPRSGGALLGSIGCRVAGHIVQFGYCYARDAWGNGYATEAARAMVPLWLAEPRVWRVQAFCDPENVASARVLEKAGLALEGLLRRYVLAPNLSDVPWDALCYARVREA